MKGVAVALGRDWTEYFNSDSKIEVEWKFFDLMADHIIIILNWCAAGP
jgi:hypothetical protein